MNATHQFATGRPVSACLDSPLASPAPTRDKWALLDALTRAAEYFGVTHRSIAVLRALMSFLPDREITAEHGSAIVFPANRTLSDRLGGMPESTLRRHLARLVDLGIVGRHDSPNRKRYARRVGGEVRLSFGFDLSPLARHASAVFAAAEEAREAEDRRRLLRDRIAGLRAELLFRRPQGTEEIVETARRLCRRKATESDLYAMIEQLEALLPPDQPAEDDPLAKAAADNTSGTALQNERHLQHSIESEIDSEGTETADNSPTDDANSFGSGNAEKPSAAETTLRLSDVLQRCRAFQDYFPDPVRSWTDLAAVATRIAPMIGISNPVLDEARRAMGTERAAIVVLCILERLEMIRSPGAYLRSLTKRTRGGRFSALPMLQAAQRHGKPRNCQLTI